MNCYVTLSLNPRPSLRAARCKSPLDYLLIAHDLGKGLALASLKAVNVICYFNVVLVWCFVCGCAGLWCHLLRFSRKTVTGALGKAGTCNTFAAKL